MNPLFNILKSSAQKVRKAAVTKYFLVLAFAVVWMLFFDRYNVMSRQSMQHQIDELQRDEAYYRTAITELEQEERRLLQDLESMERYARETYHMRKPGEDVYVIVDKE
ncbi:MAG: septum formation initiator family protein [Bacteroidota bacterium]